jgi:hypothetical protein
MAPDHPMSDLPVSDQIVLSQQVPEEVNSDTKRQIAVRDFHLDHTVSDRIIPEQLNQGPTGPELIVSIFLRVRPEHRIPGDVLGPSLKRRETTTTILSGR